MHIRHATSADLDTVLCVERAAFDEEEIVVLVRALLTDPTAAPRVNLLAMSDEGNPIGHVLLTGAEIGGHPDLHVMLLAPLAVIPTAQKQGVGAALTGRALELAQKAGIDLVFVLGHPEYYPRLGFRARAQALGFDPPYPLPDPRQQSAWMVQELRGGVIGSVRGQLVPARSFRRPEYWRE